MSTFSPERAMMGHTARVTERFRAAVPRCRHILAAFFLTTSLAAGAEISDLGWMTGCWAADGQQPGSGEQWTTPAGGTMLGTSRTIVDGNTVAFEYLRIVTGKNGQTFLIASPSGQESARFELARLDLHEVVFENSSHDFPQRIIYRLEDDEHMLGRIEGTVDGKHRSIDFPLSRTSCKETRVPE